MPTETGNTCPVLTGTRQSGLSREHIEEPPADFVCAICEREQSNRFNWRARDYERPPVCKECEAVKGHSWAGRTQFRMKPSAGAFRDRQNAIRIDALADAIAHTANQQIWDKKYGRA